MILDRLENASVLEALHPLLKTAFDFLRQADLAALPDGRHVIDGDRVFVNLDTPTLQGRAGARLETHRRYLDIQYCLSGDEEIGWRHLSTCTGAGDYDQTRDLQFLSDPPAMWFTLPPGAFAIFFPHDAHAPLAGETAVRKAVVKVALDPAPASHHAVRHPSVRKRR